MPKKEKVVVQNVIPELDEKLEELVNQIEEEEVKHEESEKREELVKASEDGYISEKVSSLRKATENTIDKLHKEYLAKRKKDADMFLTDLIISQFASVLGGLDAIESPESLTDELKANALLRKDIGNMVSLISPYIPIIGIMSGAATTGKHIYQWKTKPEPPINSPNPDQ